MKSAPKETMDRVLMYRNLLCAEDHLDEILEFARSVAERTALKDFKAGIERIRSDCGISEGDPRFHCLTKHLAVAYEAAREVAKVTHNESDLERAELIRIYLRLSLEKLTGMKLTNCARCNAQEEYEQRSAEADTEEEPTAHVSQLDVYDDSAVGSDSTARGGVNADRGI